MTDIKFQFKKVLVVAGGENVFSNQLKKWGIQFVISDEKVEAKQAPDLIIVVNKSTEKTAEPLKIRFPEAQVIVCTGGYKNFLPHVTVVHGHDDYDEYYFKDWQGFVELIGKPLAKLPKVFLPLAEKDCYYPALEIQPSPDMRLKLKRLYYSQLSVSVRYLEWYLKWLDEIGNMKFSYQFNFSVKKKTKIKSVVMPNTGIFIHRGLPIFSEEDALTFYNEADEKYWAIIDSVKDEEIIIRFSKPLSVKTVNNLVGFQKVVNKNISLAQMELCQQIIEGKNVSSSLSVLAGRTLNQGAAPIEKIGLSPKEKRFLFKDRSQCFALFDISSHYMVSPINGPAGTGKTFLTSLAVKQFWFQNKFILLVSHSNKGLDTLLSFVANCIDDDVSIFRLGNNPDNVSPENLKFHRSKRFKAKEELGSEIKFKKKKSDKELANDEIRRILYRRNEGECVILGCTMASFLIDRTLAVLKEQEIIFDISFIDEASRGFLYEIQPIINETKEKVILIGDPEQLSNIDLPSSAKQYLKSCGFTTDEIDDFGEGLFNCLVQKGFLPFCLLNINRRSLPVICDLVSRIFYNGKLIPGLFDPNDNGQVIFYDTKKAQMNREGKKGTSRYNGREANIAVGYAVSRLAKGLPWQKIGIITPYQAQIARIRKGLRKVLFLHPALENLRKNLDSSGDGNLQEKVEELLVSMVNTVDAFQGSERQEIILSFVVSNKEGDIGFNRNIRRMRVAFSRAKRRLVIIANSQTFLESEYPKIHKIFKEIIKYVKKHGKYKEIC